MKTKLTTPSPIHHYYYLITIELILRDKTLQTLDFIIGTKLFVCQHNCFKNIESFDI
jgi:hypothetical protein